MIFGFAIDAAVVRPAPGGVVTQTPRADIDTGAQVNVLAVAIVALATLGVVVSTGHAVIQQCCRDTLIPELRVNPPTCRVADSRLWQAQQQLLAFKTKITIRLGDRCQIRASTTWRTKLRVFIN
ncbi:hypothetical protein D3C75_815080 [compost metagenome]